MKRILTVFPVLIMGILLSTCSLMPEPEAPDYLTQMIDAAACADLAAGREAEILRNRLIDEHGSDECKIAFDELFLLSKFIYSQSGTYKDNEAFMLCTGEVVLNRLASREFPDTLADVIYQEGAFEGVDNDEFRCNTTPPKKCVKLALRLLMGERLLAPHVVHWSTSPETEVYATFCDRRQNFVYFCESEYPRFYHLPNKNSDA